MHWMCFIVAHFWGIKRSLLRVTGSMNRYLMTQSALSSGAALFWPTDARLSIVSHRHPMDDGSVRIESICNHFHCSSSLILHCNFRWQTNSLKNLFWQMMITTRYIHFFSKICLQSLFSQAAYGHRSKQQHDKLIDSIVHLGKKKG